MKIKLTHCEKLTERSVCELNGIESELTGRFHCSLQRLSEREAVCQETSFRK